MAMRASTWMIGTRSEHFGVKVLLFISDELWMG